MKADRGRVDACRDPRARDLDGVAQPPCGSVVNIEEMAPQTLDGHCSTKPVRFVLEMNQGWFAKRGINPGSKLRGAPFVH